MALTSRGREMISIVSVLVGLSFIAVILRAIARLKRRVHFGVDDFLSFASIILLLGMLIELGFWVTIGGNGAHQDSLSNNTMKNFYKIFLANQFTYFLLCPVIKISIICFYRRVFTTKPFQWTTFGINLLITVWGMAIFLACALQCRPLRAYWDHSVPGQCLDGMTLIIVNQAFNVLMDFVILILPIPMIWGLHRAWQDKLALNGVFALGTFVCFASIYRIVVLFWIENADTTYTVYHATLWTHVEPSVGLICSCLPIIRGLFPRFKLPSHRRYRTAPYYIPTDVSTSQFVVSAGAVAHKSSSGAAGSSTSAAARDFYKMEEGLGGSRSTSTDEHDGSSSIFTQTQHHPMDITVRTDIKVSEESSNTHV
ncbi:uncharacterized protein BP01DRAFT_306347 [Aspergillus saccharolyticus JOP 1030-1]|uniref:Rhodopsin domain-containing protein n=1 Tax=Aspergillus saccharolyticus JOP 1030-1 TaxID=1450539 RepID=A0A319A128_9EURO|nr:hypothetical protein BP01DRAFT_306347 [Aspergillus saccharolyticus JOP 1030-1]PYH41222.1 hypothetical protein BP01DRAFT_306347 [Aspergillus saccharolyticus JOP 1030-1]